MKRDKLISFIIVTYNSDSTILDCIDAINNTMQLVEDNDYEIIIVDNNSQTKTLIKNLKIPEVKFISLAENIGFAAANNIGFKASHGGLILFVNPDCIINEEFLKYVKNNVNNQCYISSILVNDEGKEQSSVHLIPTVNNLISSVFLGKNKSKLWVQGALIAINRTSFIEIGMWSEDYFMYAEDLDFCFKADKKNIKLKICKTPVRHIGGTSTSTVWNNEERLFRIEKANFIFFKKFNLVFDYLIISLLQILKSILINPKKTWNQIKMRAQIIREHQ